MPPAIRRCAWCESHPLLTEYHDSEWGVPCFDDAALFEAVVLDAMQAGLSWLTVLKKRESFRKAFDNFEAGKVARYTERSVEKLMLDAGIIRNRMKIEASIQNARAFLRIQAQHGSFASYIWRFTDGKPVVNKWASEAEIPAETELARLVSKELKAQGMGFVGPTITYAFMQAVGIVNDHTVACHRYKKVGKERR